MRDAYRVVLTPRASADLQSIFDYIVQSSEHNAPVAVERLLESIENLASLPQRYTAVSATKKRDRRPG